MEVRELEHKGNKYTFLVKGTDHTFVNTLRRLIIDEVPTMAIEDVEFKANDSLLYDEVLAHRLGLIPLKTDLKTYKFPDPSLKGEVSATTHVTFTLKTKAEGMVDASKMKSNDPKVVPVNENTPITYLGEGQKLEFNATAQLGRGRDHIKWSPGHVWFVQQHHLTVNNNTSKLEDFKNRYPPQIFDKSGKIDKNLINENQSLVDACEGICDDLVKVEYSDEDFIVYVESWGQLKPQEMVDRAMFELLQKLEELKALVSKLD